MAEFFRALQAGYPRVPYTPDRGGAKQMMELAYESGADRASVQAAVDYVRDVAMDDISEQSGEGDASKPAKTRLLDLALRGIFSERGLI